jgi:bacteriocin-like protein
MTLSAPIELNDDELAAVSGGVAPVVVVGIAQHISQSAAIEQVGGSLGIGGGNGSTSVSGNLTFTQNFSASIGQSASNTNSGNVTAGVAASG